jgi:hypothetical protein
MHEPQQWYERLSGLIGDLHAQADLARAAGISPERLECWLKGAISLCPYELYRLFCALPEHHQWLLELVAQEFARLARQGSEGGEAGEVAPVFYDRVLNAATHVPQPLRAWVVSNLVLQQAIIHLDPSRQGLTLLIARCMPPSRGGCVRTLRVSLWSHTSRTNAAPRLSASPESEAFFYGRDSLAGYTVSQAQPVVLELQEDGSLPFVHVIAREQTRSAAACPVMRGGRVAGCLLAISPQASYFTPPLLQLLHTYSDLLLLAFESEEFYERECISLVMLPPLEVQRPYLQSQRRRMVAMMKAAREQAATLEIGQAEALVWRQIEEELLTLVLSESNGHLPQGR